MAERKLSFVNEKEMYDICLDFDGEWGWSRDECIHRQWSWGQVATAHLQSRVVWANGIKCPPHFADLAE